MEVKMEEEYLGDGLYVSHDEYYVRLRAPRTVGDHEVYLEDRVLQEFILWLRRKGKLGEVRG
jgi:hypothetical protein